MDLDTILLEAEEAMDKAVDYLRSELKGVRTGRASPGLVEFVKVEAYGGESDIRSLAAISVPEPTQIVIKPFDASIVKDIARGLERAGLGLNPNVDGKVIRLSIPPLSGERRKEMVNSVKHMGEQAKVSVRNARRDANKHLDQLVKDKVASISEDAVTGAKAEVDDSTKKHEADIEAAVESKSKEVLQV